MLPTFTSIGKFSSMRRACNSETVRSSCRCALLYELQGPPPSSSKRISPACLESRVGRAKVEPLEQMISLRLGAGKMVPTVLPPIPVYFGVEVFRRESLLFADAPDLVAGFEPVTKTAQVVSPNWNRRRDWIVWTQGYTPFVRRVVPVIIIDVEVLLRRPGGRQDQRLPSVSGKGSGLPDKCGREQSPGPNQRIVDDQA